MSFYNYFSAYNSSANTFFLIYFRWAAYRGLPDLGYTHKTVNHSRHFVDPVTKCCTNLVESYWAAIKRFLRNKGPIRRSAITVYLDEFMWRERWDTSYRYILKNKRLSVSKQRSLLANNLSVTPIMKTGKCHTQCWRNFWLQVQLLS